jgi:nitrogen-specific signal transduction histidine kinase/CheY-like chemotaxis protein
VCSSDLQITVSITTYKNAPAVTGTFIDINREKLLEAELRQAQKMEAVGQLAGGVAHDFNNILTVFNGYGSVLQMKMSQDDPLRIYVDQILSTAQKAASLTQNLLTFSRQQPITVEPVDINQAILGTEKLLRRLFTEDITFSLRLSPDTIAALVDPTQLDRILFNLVSNARDAMPRGGNLVLETDFVFLDNDFRQTHGFGKSGRYAHITLTDSGVGMDKTTLEKIFNPFFTTKSTGQGTGLGLSTVYAIVKQHNGFIIADSSPSQGTTFHLYFPAVGATARKEEPFPGELKTGTERIMIADDDEDVRTFIQDALRLCGYQTIEAIDGEDAIAKFREAPEIDLVILDSVMPKKNGREAFNEIAKINPRIKALFISGYTRDVVLDKGISAREFHFLSKPITLHLLLSKVREILDEECKKSRSSGKRVLKEAGKKVK